MTVYGSRVYRSFRYGVGSTTDISVYPFTAQSLDYGTIKLSWVYPTPTSNFTTFLLVRNPSGFPITPDGGDLIYKSSKTALATAGGLLATKTSVSSSGTTFTVSNTTGLSKGQSIFVTAGTGTLSSAGYTVITSIDTTASTFTVNLAPTVPLSGATITVYGCYLDSAVPITDTGSFYDPITGSATTTYTSITTGTVDASIYVTLTAANANIKVGQLVTYTASGYLTGANAGSGIIGNTTVAAINGTTLTLSKPAYIPSGTTLTFSPTFLTPGKSYYYSAFVYTNSYWQRVGTAMGTSIKDYNTANVMYNSLPQVYLSSSTSSNKNNDLYNLLRVIGVQYDLIKTKVENAKNRYDVNNLDGKLLPALMDQMGFSYESGLGIQQSRRMLNNADYIYLNKGTGQGVKQFVTSFTGYPATINPFKNLFLTLDCASFEASDGYWSTSGNAITAVNTTPTLEGGSPAAYAESNSPTGYANSRLGYLKATITATGGQSAWELSYGTSPDSVNVPITSSFTTTTTTTGAITSSTNITLASAAGVVVGQKVSVSAGTGVLGTGAIVTSVIGSVIQVSVGSTTNFASGDTLRFDTTASNNVTDGWGITTLTTSKEHGFSVGQSIVLQGMSPNYINGIFKIIAVPNSKSFTFYNAAAASAGPSAGVITIVPVGDVGIVNLYDPVLYGIPISSSTSHKFSFYVYAPSARFIDSGIKWYDKNGTFISTGTSSSSVTTTNTWTQLSHTSSSPSYAAYGVPFIKLLNTTGAGVPTAMTVGEKYYFDALQFEATPFSTKYYDPRRVDIYLSAPRINQIINPGFETDKTNWAATGTSAFNTTTSAGNIYPTSVDGLGVAVSTRAIFMVANALTSTLAPTSPITVTGNTKYAFSVYVKGSNINDTVTATIVWKDSGGTTLQTDTSATLALPTSNFTRLSLAPTSGSTQMISPATATTATLTLTFGGFSPYGHTYYVDSVLFEASATVNAYFDGGTGYNNTDDLIWEQNAAGTKGTSETGRSLYYPNRLLTQNRLNAVLADYLPLGSTYAVFIGTTAT